jgi:hypothetical protein
MICILILHVNIKPLIESGKLGGGIVDAAFGYLWRPCSFGQRPGLYILKISVGG